MFICFLENGRDSVFVENNKRLAFSLPDLEHHMTKI